ncbi:MAG: YbjQ family protein [Acidobacteriota bacterium]
MILVTTDEIPGMEVTQVHGIVKGSSVRARHIGKDILAFLRNMVGGEIQEYTKMLAETREQSLDRMIEQAEAMGANAVICVRFATSQIMQGAAELLAYGTAVTVRPKSS